MATCHAVVRIDHQSAEVLPFDAEHVQAQKIKTHTHHTAQHGSNVRTEHAFFGQVCKALEGTPEILVVGAHKAQSDFKHCVDKHRPQLPSAIVGYESIDHPTENQLVAFARQYFLKHDRISGLPTPR